MFALARTYVGSLTSNSEPKFHDSRTRKLYNKLKVCARRAAHIWHGKIWSNKIWEIIRVEMSQAYRGRYSAQHIVMLYYFNIIIYFQLRIRWMQSTIMRLIGTSRWMSTDTHIGFIYIAATLLYKNLPTYSVKWVVWVQPRDDVLHITCHSMVG